MSKPVPGLVGRMVMTMVTRGDSKAKEPCEVMACQTGGEYGCWRVIVATHDGALLSAELSGLTLIAEPSGDGPYR